MTTFYFVGGEDHDFAKVGQCSVNTATAGVRRTANARCALAIGGSGQTISDGWVATLSGPQSSFWLTARNYTATSVANSSEPIFLRDAGGVKRLRLQIQSGTSNSFTLTKLNSTGTSTTLATNTGPWTVNVLQKIDVFINYAVAGSFQLYFDGVLALSYSGDLTTDSATALASVTLAGANTGGGATSYWSEVICADTDTRTLGLVTLAPSANGNTFNWDTGSYSAVSEITLDDSTIMTSGTVGQLAQFTVGSSGMSGVATVKAVCVSARAIKGATGPQNAKFSIRTGGTDYATAPVALPSGAFGRIQNTYLTNPGTSANWSPSDLTAAGFNIGLVSDT